MASHVIELTAKNGQAEEVVRTIGEQAVPNIIQAAEGFVDEIVLLSDTDPNRVTAISFWRSEKDAERFIRTGFDKVTALVAPFLSAKPERREFTVGFSTDQRLRGSRL